MRMRTKTGPGLGRIAHWPSLALLLMVVALAGVWSSGTRPAFAAACTYSLSSSAYSANEGEAVQVTVTETGSCSVPADQISRTTAITLTGAGTAAAGVDFQNFSSLNVNFPDIDGTPQSRTVSINTIEDNDNEGNETFTIQLTPPTGTNVVGNSSAVVTIVDDDGAQTYSYSSANFTYSEGDGLVTVTVLRGGASGTATTVDCNVTGGTASGADYSVSDGTANFGVGATSSTCSFLLTNDATTESAETITLGLTNASAGAPAGQTTTTLTINDNDGPGTVQFGSTTYNVTESTSTAQVLVTRTSGSTGTVSVTCTFSAGSATNTVDFTAGSQVVTFLTGETQQYCNVPILSDAAAESQETVAMSLSCPCTGIGGPSSPTSATLYIDDDDGSGNIAFSASSYAGTENGGAITITVVRNSGGGGGSVTYTASTGSAPAAIANTDFVATTGTLTWGVGDFTSRTFTVTPIDDATVEGSENILLTLSSPTGGLTLGAPSTAVLVLSDNESPLPVITSISPSSGTTAGGTAVTITGTNFVSVTSVMFGGFACTSVSVITTGTLTCITPTHAAGTVEVVITALSGSNSTTGTANDYTYTSGPTITSLDPATGPATGNTIVTIRGTNFTASGMVVKFDTTTAVFSFVDTTTLIAVSPAHSAGTVDVSVTSPGGTSPNTISDDYVYTGTAGPVVSLLSPASGPVGTTVIIAGSGFTGATLVTFGGIAATYTVNNDAQITASVPAGTPGGTVDVRVTTSAGTSPNTTADNFNNTSASPTITYTLYFRFTLIVWTGPNGISAIVALRGQESPDNPATNNVSTLVGAIWRFDATTQTFKGYFPGSDGVPGANDFTTLTTGVGYFVALLNPGTVTWTTLGAN